MESGLSSINVCMIEKIARALQVERFDLLNHTPENEGSPVLVVSSVRSVRMGDSEKSIMERTIVRLGSDDKLFRTRGQTSPSTIATSCCYS